MNKYIIKNCPCYAEYENKLNLCCNGEGDGECQNCTDCLLKQIVEKCKEKTKHCPECIKINSSKDCNTCVFDTNGLAENILQLLDISEVEE